jgi:hypothetical protein
MRHHPKYLERHKEQQLPRAVSKHITHSSMNYQSINKPRMRINNKPAKITDPPPAHPFLTYSHYLRTGRLKKRHPNATHPSTSSATF